MNILSTTAAGNETEDGAKREGKVSDHKLSVDPLDFERQDANFLLIEHRK